MTTPGAAEPSLASARVKAERARDALARLRDEQDRLTAQRDDAIRTLSRLGMSYDGIAATAGVSRARVGQIVTAGRGRRQPA